MHGRCSGCAQQHLLFQVYTIRTPLQSLQLFLLLLNASLVYTVAAPFVVKLEQQRHCRNQLW